MLYTGRTVGITALEKFVHVAGIMPHDFVLVRVELRENCMSEEPVIAALPPDWDVVPPGPGSMDFGTRWAHENRSLVLYVPSVLVREEGNAVLNPSHPEFVSVKISIERDFHYDLRMYAPRNIPSR